MERGVKLFLNKKGIEIGMRQLLYLIIFGAFVLILFGIIYYMKNILK